MKTKIKHLILAIAVIFVFFSFPALTHAGLCEDIADRVSEVSTYLAPDCGTGEVPSFVEFEGGLQPPSGEGLAPELTQVKSARQFILNVTNFALSFLGLIAVIIIIYGGFVYVTAHGNEEQSGKGKKSIQYAIIGILIILVSFALVNTLLKAPLGGEDRGEGEGGRGAAQEGTNIAQQRLYNIAGMEIRSSLQNFVISYQNFIEIRSGIKKILMIPGPRDGSDARRFLLEVQSALQIIISRTDRLTKVNIAAQSILDNFVDRYLVLSSTELERLLVKDPEEGGYDTDFWGDGSGGFHDAFRQAFEKSDVELANHEDFLNTIEKIKERLGLLKDSLGPITEARADSMIDRGTTSEEELKRALANIPPDFTIGQAFIETQEALDAMKQAVEPLRFSVEMFSREIEFEGTPVEAPAAEKVLALVSSMDRLYTMVKDIRFIAVRINSSVKEGNAPLPVRFDSLGSLDPSARTITDDQHEWDLDGNGRFDEEINPIGCKEILTTERGKSSGASISCLYPKAGTYRIALRVKNAADTPQIASGIAYLTLKVKPPSSRIFLKATTGDIEEILQSYDEDGRIKVNKTTYTVTLEEAKTGIRYDANGTTDGAGAPNSIIMHEWSFGDGSDPIRGPTMTTIDNPKKTYSKSGVFPLQLEVTDKGGIKDRKIVNVTVASIAARILTQSTRGDLNTAFEFDGSRSKSDMGQIVNYKWRIFNDKGKELEDIENDTSSSFRHKFKNPGKYTVKLKVADRAGNEAESEIIVFVESRPPVADFEVNGCVAPEKPCLDPTNPSLVEFDAGRSFDPDREDTLSYEWEIQNASNNDYEVISGKLSGNEDEAKKVKIKFKRAGTFKILLRIEDQHQDPELRKTATKEKEIMISSIVEADFDSSMEAAKNLEDGRALFTFKINTLNAERFKIEFGDSNVEEGEIVNNAVQVEHQYDTARTYTVLFTAISEKNGQTQVSKQIYVNRGDAPLAIISVSKNNVPIISEEGTPIEDSTRRDIFTFDGSQSINTKGKKENLDYSWDFGDGQRSVSAKTNHTFEDVSPQDPGYFEVKLTVVDRENNKISEAKVLIPIKGSKPTATALTVIKRTQAEITPIDVEVTAEGASDADGRIIEYKFWYFDPGDPERQLGVVSVVQNKVILTIETHGEADLEKKYLFCVELKDNENNVASCADLFSQESLPFVEVKNGENQAPIADFQVDRTNIKTNESVTFTSNSTDPDGRVAKYVWDVMGDGFHNDTETELSTITQIYTEKSPRAGYKVKLKVIDDKGASGYSREIVIFVDLPFNPPEANFTYTPLGGTKIKFNDTSRPAPGTDAQIVKYSWDFDTSSEFCTRQPASCQRTLCEQTPSLCDRDPTNDPDSIAQNPVFEYASSGSYEVRLQIEDTNEQKAEIAKRIDVERGRGVEEAPLTAVLRNDPAKAPDNKIHLRGNGGYITYFFGESRGNIFEYVLDKNIYFDSGAERPGIDLCSNPVPRSPESGVLQGDGCTDNDADIISQDGSRRFRTWYGRNFKTTHPEGIFTARLTVYGRDAQNRIITDTDQVDIVFDPPAGMAYLFEKLGANEGILIGIIAGATLALMGYFVSLIARRGKPRNI